MYFFHLLDFFNKKYCFILYCIFCIFLHFIYFFYFILFLSILYAAGIRVNISLKLGRTMLSNKYNMTSIASVR